MRDGEGADMVDKPDRKDDELKVFVSRVHQRHGRVDPCFMTGKGCVYTDQIDEALRTRKKNGQVKGFMIMPFRPGLRVFFENCLRPFFESNYDPIRVEKGLQPVQQPGIILERADDVPRPGIIVCEGICKRIQEADFTVADISVPNDNVFYELGLAYGIGSKIILIHQAGAEFGEQAARYFRKSTEAEHVVKQYQNLDMIEREHFNVSEYIWRREPSGDSSDQPPKVLFFEMMRDGSRDQGPGKTRGTDDDIRLSFREHVMSDIGLALNRIVDDLRQQQSDGRAVIPHDYLDGIIGKHLDRAIKIDPGDDFMVTRDRVDSSYCLIVRTGTDCHSMSYFWLGYGHARGKNVIPITTLLPEDEDAARPHPTGGQAADVRPTPVERSGQPRGKVEDLAFDIRAQRHMIFDIQHPELLERQLERTLSEMIRADFSEWSRRRFWTTLLGSRGEVSIITGGLHSKDHNREMIGDWDLRAASELTSFFSRHQYRPKIETPIYQPEFARGFDPELSTGNYIKQVINEIRVGEKNCVVIASPDVNPLTEIMLGRLFGMADEALFSELNNVPNAAFVVYKKRKTPHDPAQDETAGRGGATAPRAFYSEGVGDEAVEKRGFLSRAFEQGDEALLDYYGQNEYEPNRKAFQIYAQLIVARNPFTPKNDPPRYVVILNGVSGPATFALTQVLTGGGNEDAESMRGNAFDAAAGSESILNKFLPYLRKPDFHCIYSLVEVDVGEESQHADAAPDATAESFGRHGGAGATFDWRSVLRWQLAHGMLDGEGVKVVPARAGASGS